MKNQGENMATGAGYLILKPSSSQHHHKQPCGDAKVSINQPNSNSSMSSSTRDKNCTGTAKQPKSSETESGRKTRKGNGSKTKRGKNGNTVSVAGISIAGNTFSYNIAEKIANVEIGDTVYVSRGPNEEKRDDSGGEADSQSSSDNEE